MELNPVNGTLVVDSKLPLIDIVPTAKELKYVKARKVLVELHMPKKERKQLYEEILYQTTLRAIHELFDADEVDELDCIVFNEG